MLIALAAGGALVAARHLDRPRRSARRGTLLPRPAGSGEPAGRPGVRPDHAEPAALPRRGAVRRAAGARAARRPLRVRRGQRSRDRDRRPRLRVGLVAVRDAPAVDRRPAARGDRLRRWRGRRRRRSPERCSRSACAASCRARPLRARRSCSRPRIVGVLVAAGLRHRRAAPARACGRRRSTRCGAATTRTAHATVRVAPRSLADDPAWVTVTAWQGGGLHVDRLRARRARSVPHDRADPAARHRGSRSCACTPATRSWARRCTWPPTPRSRRPRSRPRRSSPGRCSATPRFSSASATSTSRRGCGAARRRSCVALYLSLLARSRGASGASGVRRARGDATGAAASREPAARRHRPDPDRAPVAEEARPSRRTARGAPGQDANRP